MKKKKNDQRKCARMRPSHSKHPRKRLPSTIESTNYETSVDFNTTGTVLHCHILVTIYDRWHRKKTIIKKIDSSIKKKLGGGGE